MDSSLPRLALRGAFRFAVLLLAVHLPAAPRTLVVGTNQNIGPRTHDSLQSALDEARPGDTILCARGTHPMPLEATVGVTLVGAPGAMLGTSGGALRIHHLPRGQRFVLSGFGVADGYELRLQLHDNRGAVHVSDVAVGAMARRVRGPSVWIRDCAQVALERIRTYGVVAVDAARVDRLLVSDCELTGRSSLQGRRHGPAVRAVDCRLAIAGGALSGSDDSTGQLVAPAVELDGSEIWVTGAARLRGGSAGNNLFQAAIHGSGQASVAHVGSRVALNQGSVARSQLTGRLHVDRAEAMALSAMTRRDTTSRGPGTLRVTAHGPGAVNAVLMVSLPGGTIHWPSAPLGLWLDPATTVPLGTLATDGQGVGIFETDVPPGLRAGDRFVIQAALWNDREVEASLPALWQVGG